MKGWLFASLVVIILAVVAHQRGLEPEDHDREKDRQECRQQLRNRTINEAPEYYRSSRMSEIKMPAIIVTTSEYYYSKESEIENIVTDYYLMTNGCGYLAFYDALRAHANLSVLQQVAPPSLEGKQRGISFYEHWYKDQYYFQFISKRSLADHKWYHAKYGISRYVNAFISQAFDALSDIDVLEWLQETFHFTKEEVLADEGLDTYGVGVTPVLISSWIFGALNITLDDLDPFLDKFYPSMLEVIANYYHLNLTESPYRERLQFRIDPGYFYEQKFADFLNLRFKFFNCSRECCWRILTDNQQSSYYGWADNRYWLEHIRSITRDCRYLRFYDALGYKTMRPIKAFAPVSFDREEDVGLYALEIYREQKAEVLEWFLEKYNYQLERSVDRFTRCLMSGCQWDNRRGMLQWEMKTFNYTQDELLDNDGFVFCYSGNAYLREKLSPLFNISEEAYRPRVKKDTEFLPPMKLLYCDETREVWA